MEVTANSQYNEVRYNAMGAEVKDESSTATSFELEMNNRRPKDEENTTKDTLIEDTTSKLIEDIKFLMKYGLTKDEYEELQKMIEEIKKEMKKESKTTDDIDRIEALMDKLEKMIAEIQKRISGEATIEVDKDSIQITPEQRESMSPAEEGLYKRMKAAQMAIEGLIKGNEQKDTSGHSKSEELELIEKLKQNS